MSTATVTLMELHRLLDKQSPSVRTQSRWMKFSVKLLIGGHWVEAVSHPDVVLTPHLMGMGRQGSAATYIDAAQGFLDVLSGRRPAAVANPGWERAANLMAAALEST